MLIWIKNALTPQEIRDKIMDPNSDFQKAMVEYLESVHMGEFMTGSMKSVKQNIAEEDHKNPSRVPPTETLPEPPPKKCNHSTKSDCDQCQKHTSWWTRFKQTVDEILYLSNRHTCCTDKNGNCKARFPRETHPETVVEPSTGALIMKKGEAWINTITPAVTYLMRGNTDVTSLLSGTAIKSVIAYVADYITKTPLKTHVMFQSIQQVFER
ncbi:uncharacterized protein TRAVEDRAFT_76881, partial [Trametes versicolor FP-101664 SS1]|uniref:uncharacterized protein n=1 Tax=Trametes versicolor (strain FP-101664) TaxID=717944 RepID=UPI00046234ED